MGDFRRYGCNFGYTIRCLRHRITDSCHDRTQQSIFLFPEIHNIQKLEYVVSAGGNATKDRALQQVRFEHMKFYKKLA